MSAKVFKVRMSERCFRFKPDALPSHAPPKPGVYEFVTFPGGAAKVLYVGVASPESIHDALAGHMTGKRAPTWDDLFKAAKDVYFDYVAEADAVSAEDLRDIAGALVARHKPPLNSGPAPSSGRHPEVVVEEID